MATETPTRPQRSPPRVPSQYRYFPGWTMLAIAAAAQFMSAPGQSYSVAAFKEPMRATLQISETNYSLAYSFATIISGLSLPFVGRLIDRQGARRVLPVIALLLGAGCLCMSTTASLPGLYLSFAVVRSLGQGALSLVSTWLVGEWFARRRGLATALSGVGGSLSVMTFPLWNRWLIAEFGWQIAWVAIGVMVWVVLLLPGVLLVRDRPEELGLWPDGDVHPERAAPGQATASLEITGWPLRQVMRDASFWKLLAVPATSGMVGTGLVFHQVSLLGSRDVPGGWALALISLQALIATIAALGAGWLTDRYPSRYLLAAAMLMLGGAVLLVTFLPWIGLAALYACLLGLHGSVLRSTGMVVWMTYYGRAHQGAIRGVAMAAMILAAALGPLPLALSIDFFGSYDFALFGFAVVPLVAAVLVWTTGPPCPEPPHKAVAS